MKSSFSNSAIVVAALLLTFLLFSAKPSVAETPPQFQQKPVPVTKSEAASLDGNPKGTVTEPTSETTAAGKAIAEALVSEAVHYTATAYSLRGRTASGRYVSQGIIAADPRILPLGSRVRLEAGAWSGEYLVADTGGAIRGRKIDIWTPSSREAMRFGRRKVKLTVLSYPAKRGTKKRV